MWINSVNTLARCKQTNRKRKIAPMYNLCSFSEDLLRNEDERHMQEMLRRNLSSKLHYNFSSVAYKDRMKKTDYRDHYKRFERWNAYCNIRVTWENTGLNVIWSLNWSKLRWTFKLVAVVWLLPWHYNKIVFLWFKI